MNTADMDKRDSPVQASDFGTFHSRRLITKIQCWHTQSPEKLPLPNNELAQELEKLDKMFWIDQQKLKDITKQFEIELDQGLKKNDQNIVCFFNPWWPSQTLIDIL